MREDEDRNATNGLVNEANEPTANDSSVRFSLSFHLQRNERSFSISMLDERNLKRTLSIDKLVSSRPHRRLRQELRYDPMPSEEAGTIAKALHELLSDLLAPDGGR
jgi:hypothetical protein